MNTFTKIAIDKTADVDAILDALHGSVDWLGDQYDNGRHEFQHLVDAKNDVGEHLGKAKDSLVNHLGRAWDHETGETTLLDKLQHGARDFGNSAKEHGEALLNSIKGHAADAHAAIDNLISHNPSKALAAAAGAAGGAAGGAGLLGYLKGKKSGKKGASDIAERLKALSGRNKKLALIAALGIPSAAGAAYLATRKSK